VFYTVDNARRIDIIRDFINTVNEDYKKYFMAQLLSEASIHTNTAGIFKGFYKDNKTGLGKYGGSGENALSRILGKINITHPTLSNFETEYKVYQEDANILVNKLKNEDIDITYIDPPYNQHPYGSNYFMLNVILNQFVDENNISRVSGIPTN
jgi:adenine-specific DNA-methyltransferase